uniref:Integrase catalytic domain-containing protein n=1 Tax=Lactuca sativa TaxID=4236 RepID=A0A9R1XGZ3_LACSA|nr:hypothetical protein LSAT_V11C400181580 [Lactuca sativa]
MLGMGKTVQDPGACISGTFAGVLCRHKHTSRRSKSRRKNAKPKRPRSNPTSPEREGVVSSFGPHKPNRGFQRRRKGFGPSRKKIKQGQEGCRSTTQPEDTYKRQEKLTEVIEAKQYNQAFKNLYICSPFTDNINETPIPKGLKGPRVPPYDDTGDLDDHVSNLQWVIRMIPIDPRLWSLYFAGTLDRSARYWLAILPPRSEEDPGDKLKREWKVTNIEFSLHDPIPFDRKGTESLITKAEIGRTLIRRVYVDNANTVNVMYEHCLKGIPPDIQRYLKPATTAMVGFVGQSVWPRGKILLPFTLEDHGPVEGVVIVQSTTPCPLERSHDVQPEQAEPMEEEGVSSVDTKEKADGMMRMCVDFTDLNKACPKDSYPLLEIDQKIESLGGYRRKSFLDAYKGYHQVKMAIADEDKTAFHTKKRTFCYMKMYFSLRNAGATYQRLVEKLFAKQVGRNVEVYVDNIVIKSKGGGGQRFFGRCGRNPQKATTGQHEAQSKEKHFGDTKGKFLGHIETKIGIEASPEKVERRKDILWLDEAEEALQKLKQSLKKLLTLASPLKDEVLTMYLSASHEVVSTTLVAKRGMKQVPIYFVSRVLQGTERNYSKVEKLVLSLVYAARWLHRYFHVHPIEVLTDQPMKQILLQPERSGRMTKRVIELGEHNTTYKPQISIKRQALNDFLMENGKQIAENPFKKWCQEKGIQQNFTSVAHPHANGQVEVTNRNLVKGIKKRLGKVKGNWADELQHVLWAYQTMVQTLTKDTSFRLVYGTEAIIPIEVMIRTNRTSNPEIRSNITNLRTNLDLLEEKLLDKVSKSITISVMYLTRLAWSIWVA